METQDIRICFLMRCGCLQAVLLGLATMNISDLAYFTQPQYASFTTQCTCFHGLLLHPDSYTYFGMLCQLTFTAYLWTFHALYLFHSWKDLSHTSSSPLFARILMWMLFLVLIGWESANISVMQAGQIWVRFPVSSPKLLRYFKQYAYLIFI